MHRFSSLSRKPGSSADGQSASDSTTTVGEKAEPEALARPSLTIKRVDHYYSKWYKSWKYRNTGAKVAVESRPAHRSGENDPWKDSAFVVVRQIPREEGCEPTFKIVIKSEYILQACKDVIQTWPGLSWNADPLELSPQVFLTFLDQFVEYRDALNEKKRSELENYVLASTNVLLSAFQSDYQVTIATIKRLKKHNEITFEYLYSILVPRTLFVTQCAITGQPRLFRLFSWTTTSIQGKPYYQLTLESYDLVDKSATQSVDVGKIRSTVLLGYFRGTTKIGNLDAYPLIFHYDPEGLTREIRQRGKKWTGLAGVHHKQFSGTAALKKDQQLVRHTVNGRIMVDRASHKKFNPNYAYPEEVYEPVKYESAGAFVPVRRATSTDSGWNVNGPPPTAPPPAAANGNLVMRRNGEQEKVSREELNDEELLLTPTTVHGFSLSDKLWLEFDITKIEDVSWNKEAFENLVLPSSHKTLLQSLVEAHRHKHGIDDFIRGKGQGLIVNLFGPPGVGKTFSAEATSEHVKRPLYVVGAGELGITAAKLDEALTQVFEIAAGWNAIVLIDEADVFLEQRSLHELDRNAMVAVFLRHLEYYAGILFLTTNRVKAFDEAFLSRIHVALHFRELSVESRKQVWLAFMQKLAMHEKITDEQISSLAEREVNGRQIKNAARTAQSLALGRGETLEFKHFIHTLDVMGDFITEFKS